MHHKPGTWWPSTLKLLGINWMIPNLYIGNGCFTKHPLKIGRLGYQAYIVCHLFSAGGEFLFLQISMCSQDPTPPGPAKSLRSYEQFVTYLRSGNAQVIVFLVQVWDCAPTWQVSIGGRKSCSCHLQEEHMDVVNQVIDDLKREAGKPSCRKNVRTNWGEFQDILGEG